MPRLFDIDYKTLADIGVAGSSDAIVACVEQGTNEWFGLRCGILSASHASDVITSTDKPCKGQTRETYICGLVAERLTKVIEHNKVTPAMERGTNLEPKARAWYEFETGNTVQQVGFVYRDDKKDCGCSPDGLCADRGVEIKCPMRKKMISTILHVHKTGKVPTDYISQMQFSMWVTGLDKWDFVAYTPEPEIPNVLLTLEANEEMRTQLDSLVPAFCADVLGKLAIINEQEGA